MKKLLLALAILCVSSSAFAWKKGPAPVALSAPWTGLNLQGGGRFSGQSLTSDNYLISRVDVYGAYSLNLATAGTTGSPNAVWQQFVTGTSLASFINGANNNFSPAPFKWNGDEPGAQEIVAAPSNPNRMMMFWQRGFFYSTDHGAHWTVSASVNCSAPCNSSANSAGIKNYNAKIAIDPANENIAYASGGSRQGMYFTTDGGVTWTLVDASFPVPASRGAFAIIYDSSGGTLTGASCPNSVSPCTQNVYATPSGSLPYFSSNSGQTWTQVTSGGAPPGATNPTMYGKILANGTLLYIDDTSGLGSQGHFVYTYTGGLAGTWTASMTTAPPEGGGPRAVAIDPFSCSAPITNCRVVVVGPNGSTNVGSVTGSLITWAGWSNAPSTSIPSPNFTYSGARTWLSQISGGGAFIGTHALDFDPLVQNKLWMCASGSCFYATGLGSSTAGTNFHWNDYGYNTYLFGPPSDVMVPPGSPNVITTAADMWLWTTPVRNNGGANATVIFQSTCSLGGANNLGQGWNLEYASSNPAYVYAPIIGELAAGPPPGVICWNSNYGSGTWLGMGVAASTAPVACGSGTTTMPQEQLQSAGLPYNYQGAVAASTPCALIYAGNNRQPWYTTDGGATWNRVSLYTASGNLIGDTSYFNIAAGWALNAVTVTVPAGACNNVVAGTGTHIIGPVPASNSQIGTVASCIGTTLTVAGGGLSAGCVNSGGNCNLYISPWCCSGTLFGQPVGSLARAVAADRLAANTFYMQYGLGQSSGTGHPEFGTYKTINGGATWTQITGGSNPGQVFDGTTIQILAVPAVTGQLFASGKRSEQSGAWLTYSVKPATTTGKLYFLKDNGGTGQSWSTVPFVLDMSAFCIGQDKPGSPYSTLYVFGFTSQNSGGTYNYGLWRSTTFDPNNPTADPQWTAVGSNPGNGYALDYPLVSQCAASHDVYGEIYAMFNPGAFAWGVFP